jgi:branched-chain amino acid transport system permease protein
VDGVIATSVAGLGDGVVYAALALALVLVHRTSGSVNFAQGELAMIGVFLGWALHDAGVPVWPAALLAVVASALLAMVIRATVLSRFSSGDHGVLAIATLGLLFIPAGIAGAIWGYTPKRFPALFGSGSWTVGGVAVRASELGGLATLAVVAGGLGLLLTRTRVGLGLRAAAAHPASSALVGIPVERLLVFGWGLAGGIGAVAGILAAPTLFVSPTMMLPVLLYAFAAASIGGFDSLGGAVVGGLVVGVLEAVAGAYVPGVGNELKLVVALVVIVIVLVVKPDGLFSTRKVERV